MDAEAGESAPRGLAPHCSRNSSDVEMFVHLSADWDRPSVTWRCRLPCLVTPVQAFWGGGGGKPSARAGACPWVQSSTAPSLPGWGWWVPRWSSRATSPRLCLDSFPKDVRVQRGMLYFPDACPRKQLGAVTAQPPSCPAELTVPPRRHGFHEQSSPSCSRHGAGCCAWRLQISSSPRL